MEAIKILVCDDSKFDLDELATKIKKILPNANLTLATSGKEVFQALDNDPDMDFIFLDIYIEEINGLQIAKRIQNHYGDCKIVFVSDSRAFGPEAFALGAVHYLLKPVDVNALNKLFEQHRTKDMVSIRVLDVQTRQNVDVHLRNIEYIESAHNYVYLHLIKGNTIKYRISISELEKLLDERFLKISRGIVVNMDRIEKMTTDLCQIKGQMFMLSRKNKINIRKTFHHYIFQKYMEKEHD